MRRQEDRRTRRQDNGLRQYFTRILSGILVLLPSLLFLSCTADNEFSTWPCRFAYDNSIGQDATLATAMDANSRGVFCQITESVQGGVKYLNFSNNQGLTSSKRETALEQQANFVLGLNNGIIIGWQTFVTDGFGAGFAAYDVQCPNCVRRENNTISPNYRITMSSNGIATCSKCGLKYDLNNGGIVQNGQQGDTGLEKYAAATTGAYGYISVFRKQ